MFNILGFGGLKKPILGGLKKPQEFLCLKGFNLPLFLVNLPHFTGLELFFTISSVEMMIQKHGPLHEICNVAFSNNTSIIVVTFESSERLPLTDYLDHKGPFFIASSGHFKLLPKSDRDKFLNLACWGKDSPSVFRKVMLLRFFLLNNRQLLPNLKQQLNIIFSSRQLWNISVFGNEVSKL